VEFVQDQIVGGFKLLYSQAWEVPSREFVSQRLALSERRESFPVRMLIAKTYALSAKYQDIVDTLGALRLNGPICIKTSLTGLFML